MSSREAPASYRLTLTPKALPSVDGSVPNFLDWIHESRAHLGVALFFESLAAPTKAENRICTSRWVQLT